MPTVFPGHPEDVTEPCTATNPCASCVARLGLADEVKAGASKGSMFLADREWLSERLDIILTAIEHARNEGITQDDYYQRGLSDGRDAQARDCTTDHEHAQQVAFERGLKIGKAERDAELLDAGWTPRGAITEEIELKGATIKGRFIVPEGVKTVKNGVFSDEISAGPTDYEVWRDALTLAAGRTPVNDKSPHSDRQSVRYDAHGWAAELRTLGHSVPDDEADPDDDDQAEQETETRSAADPREIGPY